MVQHDSPAGAFPTLRRFAAWYQRVAIIVLNTLLLIGLLLLLMVGLVNLQDRGGARHTYSDSLKLETFKTVQPDMARATAAEYDRMASYESFEFNPWTCFMHRAFAGRHLNVDAHGLFNLRRTAAPDALREGQQDLLVWAFGGSTMFGWGMPDGQTIPSWLQHELGERLPGFRPRVVNCGQAYYFSSQELAQYTAMLRVDERPRVVLFLDGLNDTVRLVEGCEVPYFADAAYRGWEDQRAQRYAHGGPWLTFNGSFPPFRLMRRASSAGDRPTNSIYISPPSDPIGLTVATYRFNRNAALALSASLGIEAYCFLQPLTDYGQYTQHRPSIAPGNSEVTRAVYDTLIAEARAGSTPRFHSLHDVLFQLESPYIDISHYSDEGCRTVAAAMADVIASGLTAAAVDD